jgi:hypothetical protein
VPRGCRTGGRVPSVATVFKGTSRLYLEYEDGTPFFYLGDTAWELFHRLNREEADRYLEEPGGQGLHGDPGGGGGGTGRSGPTRIPTATCPCRQRPDAAERGLLPHVDYIVSGRIWAWSSACCRRGAATGRSARASSRGERRVYGRFLGRRYKDRPIIWILGGDHNPTTTASGRPSRRWPWGSRRVTAGGT